MLLRRQTMSRLGADTERYAHTLLVDVRVHKVTRDLVGERERARAKEREREREKERAREQERQCM